MDDTPLDRQKFKLLPPSEREFVEIITKIQSNQVPTKELEERYKNPENTILQYNNRIRYRTINAIKEIAWLCDKLPENQLKKIFSDERIEELFKTTEKALDAADWKPDEKEHAKVLEDFLFTLLEHRYAETDLLAYKKLLRELYESPSELMMSMLRHSNFYVHHLAEMSELKSFLEEKGLIEEYEARQKQKRAELVSVLARQMTE